MAEEIHDECGIAGVYFFKNHHEKNVVPLLYKMLLNLQNRGQLSAGISTYSDNRSNILQTYKELGTVNEAFQTKENGHTKKLFENYAGRIGIGHVRYSTFGLPDKSYAHPFERPHGRKSKWFSFCFNGNIANYEKLKNDLLEKKDYHIVYNSDTEIMLHYISLELAVECQRVSCENRLPDLFDIFRNLSLKFDGAYSVAYMDAEGRLVALRDPLGIRPLCYSIDNEKLAFASESIALESIGCENIKFLNAGEIIIAENNNVRIEKYSDSIQKAMCMFEFVYFANVASTMENRSIYESRFSFGVELAKQEYLSLNPREYVVISVPDSSKPFGEGYSHYFGLPHKEGLVRNRYVGRTFIESCDRDEKVENKFSLIKEVIKDKKVLLLDDSIIRGTTCKNLVRFIRDKGGAKEIHLRVSCPVVVRPCFYGIDMSSVSELIAAKYIDEVGKGLSNEASKKLAQELGADSLLYQKIENLPKAIGIPADNLCMACLNGKYPTPYGITLSKKALNNNKTGNCNRTYE
ncbi:MAG: amidophosphoribosyltransferase [archaeon]